MNFSHTLTDYTQPEELLNYKFNGVQSEIANFA